MAQFYTLEEAARVLGMSAEELKTKAQSREVRAFLDGGSWRFRVVDVDELARRRGLGSDAELRLSDLEVPGGKSGSGEVQDLDLSEFHLGVAKPDLGAESAHISKVDQAAASPGRQRLRSRHPARRPDAAAQPDHRLELGDHRRPLVGQAPERFRRPARARHRQRGERLRRAARLPDSQAAQRFGRDPDQGRYGRSRHHRLGQLERYVGARQPVRWVRRPRSPRPRPDSDFELNPSSELIDALQPDSGSDFELSALDASDEFESTPLSKPSDSDVTASDPKLSGINLSRPSDSGINLQTGAGLGLGQADSIELAPLSDEEIQDAQGDARGEAVQAQAIAGGHAPAVRQEGREGHLRRHRLRGRRPHRPTPIPTTRPSSSKPPATSTWKTATPAPRSSPSTRRPSIRTPRPPWPPRRSPRTTRTRRTTASIRPSPAR